VEVAAVQAEAHFEHNFVIWGHDRATCPREAFAEGNARRNVALVVV
jgi:hypothetical protein